MSSTVRANTFLDGAGGNTATINGITPALASQAEAEAGTDNTKLMTPLRVKDASKFVWATPQATTSGTAFDFLGIPSWATRIVVFFDGVSLSGTDNYLIQFGTSGGFETTGYDSDSQTLQSTATGGNSTSGFLIFGNAATVVLGGYAQMLLVEPAANKWSMTSLLAGASGRTVMSGGRKSLSGVLTQVRITRTGTNTFDAGSVNVGYR